MQLLKRICVLLCLVFITQCRPKLPTDADFPMAASLTNQTQFHSRSVLEKHFMRIIGRFYCNNTAYRTEPKNRIQFWNKNHPFPYESIGHGYLDDNGGLDITIHDYFTAPNPPSFEIQFFMNYTCGCQKKFESDRLKIKAEHWDLDEAQQHPYDIGRICLDVYCKNSQYWKWTKDMCRV